MQVDPAAVRAFVTEQFSATHADEHHPTAARQPGHGDLPSHARRDPDPRDHRGRRALRELTRGATGPAPRQTARRDRQFSASPGPHPPLHARRAARPHALPGRRPRRVPAQPRRHRPRHLPVDARPRHRRRNAWSPTRSRSTPRRRGPPARGARPPRAQPRAGGRHRRLRHRPGGDDGGVHALRAPVRRRTSSTAPRRGRSTHPAGSSTRAPTRTDAASPTSAAGRCTSTTSPPGRPRTLAAPEAPQVAYGLADFVAAEEMERMRGYWWSPDGRRAGRRPRRRHTRAALAHRRPRAPRPRAHRRRLPGGGHAERAGQRRDHHAGRAARPRSAGTEEYLADVVWDDHGAARRRRSPATRRPCARCASTRPPAPPRSTTSAPTRSGSTSCPGCPRTPPRARW